MQKRLLTIMLLCITIFSYAQRISIEGNKFYVDDNEIWMNGVNTPWDLWCDFGHPDFDYDWWDEEFASYEENHINLARVWIHCNGDISPNIDTSGYVSGVDDVFWDHMDYLFEISKKYGVYVMPALLSFDITKNTYDNYTSWRNWLQSTDNIQSYIDNVLIPMVERYEDEPYLLGWEICNEPEWMFENDEHGPQSFDDVQLMHAMFAAAIHENCSRYVTTGSAAPKWNSPIYDSWGDNEGNMFSDSALAAAADNENAYLDFYQYHWYAWQTEWMDSPWTKSTEEYEVDDRPVIVGECEGEDVCDDFTCLTIAEEYEAAYQNGFDGVCGWKTDTAVYNNIITATNSFYNDHADLVYPEGSRPTEVTGLTLSATSISIEGNETYELIATVEPADATVPDVLFESASPTIASVSDEGIITGITPGTTTITVSTLVGDITATCTVEVTSSGSYGNCTNPVSVALPYTYSGEGPVCYVTSGDITVVQSYSTDLVELNGTDITNEWYTDIPGSLDGVYWIYYEADAYGYLGIKGSGGEDGEADDDDDDDDEVTDTTYSLTVTIEGEGSVSPASGEYAIGDTVTLTASETNDAYTFSEWSGDATGTDLTISIVMDADKSVTATFVEVEADSVYYTLTVSTDGQGSVEVSPAADSYLEGTSVTITASADSGYIFDSWSGDASGTSETISITMDANKSLTATFTEEGEDEEEEVDTTDFCDDPETISLSYSFDGEDEGCYVTTDDISYFNSWCMESVEINGTDYTNTYVSSYSENAPDKVDGKYYIYLKGNYSWSHFEAISSSTKSTTAIDNASVSENISVYPNPFNDELYINLGTGNDIQSIQIFNTMGQLVFDRDEAGAEGVIQIDLSLPASLYILKVKTANETITKTIVNK